MSTNSNSRESTIWAFDRNEVYSYNFIIQRIGNDIRRLHHVMTRHETTAKATSRPYATRLGSAARHSTIRRHHKNETQEQYQTKAQPRRDDLQKDVEKLLNARFDNLLSSNRISFSAGFIRVVRCSQLDTLTYKRLLFT